MMGKEEERKREGTRNEEKLAERKTLVGRSLKEENKGI